MTRESHPPPGSAPPHPLWQELAREASPALRSVVLLTVLTGLVFPFALAGLTLPFFGHRAGGSLITRDGAVVGSELIGQGFSRPGYFHPRPSAAGAGYDGMQSGGTNLGPASPKLRDGDGKDLVGVRALAEAYRRDNGLAPGAPVPIDAVTRSGSGLDPHISPANAALQAPRVARARHLDEDQVRRIVGESTRGPDLGLLGEGRVDVLALNLALDRAAPLPPPERP
jgi:K+-transporting ATPase ATPase C chain